MQVQSEYNCKRAQDNILNCAAKEKKLMWAWTDWLSVLWKTVSPILQVGVKPGQLVAVHQVLGVAEVWQWIGVVAQIGQSVGMIISTFHHGIQQGVLAVGWRVGPVCSIWKVKQNPCKAAAEGFNHTETNLYVVFLQTNKVKSKITFGFISIKTRDKNIFAEKAKWKQLI